jgi:hypothetical protein
MIRRTISLESRGDVCARSTCLCVSFDGPGTDNDPELDFEFALMEALEAEDVPAEGERDLTDAGI